jgi:PAS domain S-box-containing protein
MSLRSNKLSGKDSEIGVGLKYNFSEFSGLESGLWELDVDTNEIYWSEEMYHIFRLSSDIAIDLDKMASFFQEKNRFLKFIDQAKNRVDLSSITLKCESLANSDHWVRITCKSIQYDKQIVKLYGTVQDMGTHKRVEDYLKSALEELQERNKEQACLFNVSKLNERKHTLKELIDKTINFIQHGFQNPDLAEVRIQFDGETYQSENYKDSNKRLSSVSKRIHHLPVAIDVIYLDGAKAPEFLQEEQELIDTIARLLSLKIYQKISREELEKSNREKEVILESIGDGFFAVEEDWTVSYWNKKAEEILGKKKEEILGKNLWEQYEEAVPLKFYTEYHKAMKEKVSVHFEEYFPPLKKWFEVSAYPSEKGVAVYFVDATERKSSERKLKELNKSLEEQANELAKSNAELEQFAFVASHDLQEPLRMVSSFLTQLKRKYNDQLDEKAQQYIHFATDGAERMRQIILDLLEFSRVGSVETEKAEIDLNEVLNEVLADQKNTIEEKNAVINFSDLPVIRASEIHMKQLLQNLISNGLKYQRDGNQPVIDIFVQEKDDSWLFCVSDNGIGIESKYHEKIFAIFQRLHAKGEYSGTGIGLTICKKIVEQHNGEIWVESELNEGSDFCFTISKY